MKSAVLTLLIGQVFLSYAEPAQGALTQRVEANIDAMAWYYLGVLQAVLNFPQTGVDRSVLDQMIDVAMSAWPVQGRGSNGALTK